MKIVDKIIFGLLIPFCFVTCGQTESEYYFYQYRPSYPGEKARFKLETDYTYKVNKPRYELTYINDLDTVTYFLNQDSIQSSKIRYGDGTFQDMTWDKRIIVNDARDTIYKFTTDTRTSDGETAYYWSREFGILLTQSTSWPNSRILQTGDKEKNSKIKDLINTACPNKQYYFNGQVENVLND